MNIENALIGMIGSLARLKESYADDIPNLPDSFAKGYAKGKSDAYKVAEEYLQNLLEEYKATNEQR